MLLNFILHSMRDESDKATTASIENKQCIFTLGVNLQCVFYTGAYLSRSNPSLSFTVRTAYFHPVFREIAHQNYILKSNRDTALRF